MVITTDTLIKKTLALGASAAGVVSVSAMGNSRSENFVNRHGFYAGDMDSASMATVAEPVWRRSAKSLLVFSVAHPKERPELDFWAKDISGGTQGNGLLIGIKQITRVLAGYF